MNFITIMKNLFLSILAIATLTLVSCGGTETKKADEVSPWMMTFDNAYNWLDLFEKEFDLSSVFVFS